MRQEPIDDDKLSPQDNLEEFGQLSEADLAYYRARSNGWSSIPTAAAS